MELKLQQFRNLWQWAEAAAKAFQGCEASQPALGGLG